jgi:hypothetical protein
MQHNSKDIEYLITEYLKSLTDVERKALQIAQDQLESSFCIEKSIGYLEWFKIKK